MLLNEQCPQHFLQYRGFSRLFATAAEASVYILNYLTSNLQSTLLFVFIFLSFNKYYFEVVS